jgi:4-hydroxybenzoate polyprenyltransferase
MTLRRILEMIRFSHTLFALPFALLAAVMAWTAKGGVTSHTTAEVASQVTFRWQDLLGIILCMVSARSAAMAFNRIVDRQVDARNPRTANRHLPAGSLGLSSVVAFTASSSLAFVASTLLFLPNRLPLYLCLPVLVFLMSYSYAKRFTTLAHVWLGAALMLAPVSAWIAIRGAAVQDYPLDLLPAVWLGAAVLLWVTGFDIIYACQDMEFDKAEGLFSVPARFGISTSLRFAAMCHIGMFVFLATLPVLHYLGGPRLDLGWIYATGVAVVGLLLVYEHWIVRPDDLTRVNLAFFQVNAILSLGLFAVGTFDLLI